jgi:hypothetical protein
LMAVRVEYEPIFSAARNSYYDADNFRGNWIGIQYHLEFVFAGMHRLNRIGKMRGNSNFNLLLMN